MTNLASIIMAGFLVEMFVIRDMADFKPFFVVSIICGSLAYVIEIIFAR